MSIVLAPRGASGARPLPALGLAWPAAPRSENEEHRPREASGCQVGWRGTPASAAMMKPRRETRPRAGGWPTVRQPESRDHPAAATAASAYRVGRGYDSATIAKQYSDLRRPSSASPASSDPRLHIPGTELWWAPSGHCSKMLRLFPLIPAITSCAHGDTICPRPSPPPVGAQAPGAPPSRRNVAVLSHAEYVLTLTAAAALSVKAALSKAAQPGDLEIWPFDLESGVRFTCDVGYLCQF